VTDGIEAAIAAVTEAEIEAAIAGKTLWLNNYEQNNIQLNKTFCKTPIQKP
jgi:hypothetical protein